MRLVLQVSLALLVALAVLMPQRLYAQSDPGKELEVKYGVVTDATPNFRLKTITDRLDVGVKALHPKWKRTFSYKILCDKDLNACALADGRIYVTSGMMEAAKTDDELAGVMAHEITHVVEKHHSRQMGGILIGMLLGVGVSLATGGDTKDAVETGASVGGMLIGSSYSRTDEKKADLGGVRLLKASGYNPGAMADTLQMLVDNYGRGMANVPILGWFSSHPDTKERVNWARQEAGQVGQIPVAYIAPTPVLQASLLFGGQANGPVIVVAKFKNPDNYYSDNGLGDLAQEEAMRVLQNKGYQPRAASGSQDLRDVQDELTIENSEWGRNGQNRNDIGGLAGAQYVVNGTVKPIGMGENEIQTRVASGTLKELTVEVVVKAFRTADGVMAGQILKAQGTAYALSDVQVAALRKTWWGVITEAEFKRRLCVDISRRAVAAAIDKAFYSEPVITSLPTQSLSLQPVVPVQPQVISEPQDLSAMHFDPAKEVTLVLHIRQTNGTEIVWHLRDKAGMFWAADRVEWWSNDLILVRVKLKKDTVQQALNTGTVDVQGWLDYPHVGDDRSFGCATRVQLTAR